jgi:hypothetical protein
VPAPPTHRRFPNIGNVEWVRRDAVGESDERSDPLDEAARLFGHALEEWTDGRPAQALQPCLDALAITERMLGPSLDTIGILNTLSGIRLDLSDQETVDSFTRPSRIVKSTVDQGSAAAAQRLLLEGQTHANASSRPALRRGLLRRDGYCLRRWTSRANG